MHLRIAVVFVEQYHAYSQLPLGEKSKEFVTVNTHTGLFRYNRLSYGINSAPAKHLAGPTACRRVLRLHHLGWCDKGATPGNAGHGLG